MVLFSIYQISTVFQQFPNQISTKLSKITCEYDTHPLAKTLIRRTGTGMLQDVTCTSVLSSFFTSDTATGTPQTPEA
jgi:hypothetical protein